MAFCDYFIFWVVRSGICSPPPLSVAAKSVGGAVLNLAGASYANNTPVCIFSMFLYIHC